MGVKLRTVYAVESKSVQSVAGLFSTSRADGPSAATTKGGSFVPCEVFRKNLSATRIDIRAL